MADLRHVVRHVLDGVHHEQEQHHVAQRVHGLAPGDGPAHRPAKELDDGPGVGAQERVQPPQRVTLAKEDAQKGDEQRVAERVQGRPQRHGDDGQPEQPRVGANVAKDAEVRVHRGVSSATGRIISSGLTPAVQKRSAIARLVLAQLGGIDEEDVFQREQVVGGRAPRGKAQHALLVGAERSASGPPRAGPPRTCSAGWRRVALGEHGGGAVAVDATPWSRRDKHGHAQAHGLADGGTAPSARTTAA